MPDVLIPARSWRRRWAPIVVALVLTACAAPGPGARDTVQPVAAAPYAAFAAEVDAAWDYAQPAVSETRFRTLLAAWPDDTPQRLEVLTQLARAQGLQQHYSEAHATLDVVEARLATMPAHVRVRYLLERGRVYGSSSTPERAVPLLALALELAECADDQFYAIDAAHMLGIASPPAERAAWDVRALAMTERATDPRARRWVGPLYNNLGWATFDAGDPVTALAHFRKAEAAYATRNDPEALRTARWTVARALRATGALDEATRIQRALEHEHAQDGTVDGYVFEELGELALARGDEADARNWFAKAWSALHDDAALRADPARLARMAKLGGIAAPEAR